MIWFFVSKIHDTYSILPKYNNMTLDIPKSRIVIRISLLLVYLTLSSQVFDSKPLYAITTPYSPEIYILNASSTAASVLNKSSSSIVSINAVKVWQENGEFNRILKLGSKGNDVKVLQIILKSLTVDKTKNSTTGYFGPNTQEQSSSCCKISYRC